MLLRHRNTVSNFYNENKGMVWILFLLTFFIYSSTVFLPYLLTDENWLLRAPSATGEYPGLKDMVALTQGRPIFAVMLKMTRILAHLTSQTATIQVLRSLAIACIAIFACQILSLSRKIKLSGAVSAPIVIGAIALPIFQVFVGNATWLAVPLIILAWGFLKIFNYVFNESSETGFIRMASFVISANVISLATYQSLVMINLSLLLVVYLFGSEQVKPFQMRKLIALVLGITAVSILIYLELWRLSFHFFNGNMQEHRYSPGNVHLMNIIDHLYNFITFRLQQGSNFWVSPHSFNLFLIILFTVFLGCIVNIRSLSWKGNDNIRASIKSVLSSGLFIVFIIVGSDLIILSSPIIINSYTTIVALSFDCYLLFLWSIFSILSVFKKNSLTISVSIAICFIALLIAQFNVLTKFSLPNWLMANMLEDTILDVTKNGYPINSITIYQTTTPLRSLHHVDHSRDMYVEFHWFNSGGSFYIYWSLKNIFDQLKIQHFPDIIYLSDDSGNGKSVVNGDSHLANGKDIVFDFRRESAVKVRVS